MILKFAICNTFHLRSQSIWYDLLVLEICSILQSVYVIDAANADVVQTQDHYWASTLPGQSNPSTFNWTKENLCIVLILSMHVYRNGLVAGKLPEDQLHIIVSYLSKIVIHLSYTHTLCVFVFTWMYSEIRLQKVNKIPNSAKNNWQQKNHNRNPMTPDKLEWKDYAYNTYLLCYH